MQRPTQITGSEHDSARPASWPHRRSTRRVLEGMLLLLAAITLAACGSKASAGPGAASDTGAAGSTGSSSSNGAGAVPRLPGKLLVTGISTLDLIADGKQTSILRSPTNTSYFEYPAFSPDGKRIAYVLATTPTAQGQDWGNDIYVANLDGSDARLVLKHDHPGVLIDALSWTPDGSSLIYAYYLSQYDAQGHYTGQITRIERLNLADGSRTTVLDNAYQPSLSWDGKQMVYIVYPQNDFQQAPMLAIANIDGSDAHAILTNQKGFQAIFAPHLSPDGKQVVFGAVGGPIGLTPSPGTAPASATPSGRRSPSGVLQGLASSFAGLLRPAAASADGSPYQVWVANIDGTNLHTLGNLREDLPYPLWSTDGKSILFLGAAGLYLSPVDGSAVKRIGNGVAHGQIAWYQK